jgi:hypothetical protein
MQESEETTSPEATIGFRLWALDSWPVALERRARTYIATSPPVA